MHAPHSEERQNVKVSGGMSAEFPQLGFRTVLTTALRTGAASSSWEHHNHGDCERGDSKTRNRIHRAVRIAACEARQGSAVHPQRRPLGPYRQAGGRGCDNDARRHDASHGRGDIEGSHGRRCRCGRGRVRRSGCLPGLVGAHAEAPSPDPPQVPHARWRACGGARPPHHGGEWQE